MFRKMVLCLGLLLIASTANAADPITSAASDSTMTAIRGGMICLCLIIAILTIAVKSSLDGSDIQVSHVVHRLLFVVLALMAAGKIQGFIWGTGESIANHFLPGPGIEDLEQTLQDRVNKMQLDNGNFKDTPSITNVTGILNYIAYHALMLIESGALTLFFLIFKLFKAVQHVVMMFLGAMAPFMISASIIPGVNGFTNWLKLVICVALWPVVAAFFLKAHLMSATALIGGASGPIFGQDAGSYLNMDALQLLSESLIFAVFILATPFVSMAIVSGSAGAFSAGSSLLLGAFSYEVLTKEITTSKSERGNNGGYEKRFIETGETSAKQPWQSQGMISQANNGGFPASAKFQNITPTSPKREPT